MRGGEEQIREDANQRDASLHDRSSGTRVLLVLPVMQWCLAGCNYLERTVLNRQVSKHDVARASYSQRCRGAIVPNPKVFNNSAVFCYHHRPSCIFHRALCRRGTAVTFGIARRRPKEEHHDSQPNESRHRALSALVSLLNFSSVDTPGNSPFILFITTRCAAIPGCFAQLCSR